MEHFKRTFCNDCTHQVLECAVHCNVDYTHLELSGEYRSSEGVVQWRIGPSEKGGCIKVATQKLLERCIIGAYIYVYSGMKVLDVSMLLSRWYTLFGRKKKKSVLEGMGKDEQEGGGFWSELKGQGERWKVFHRSL